ncbi:hypothetical protein QJS10_CPB21g01394 [Acorus calamus]|uniref:KIB1-4 beta-propeller domain-containing protein n=1 Tax=Acorus calamus TaxID=4465 RepID=A0AAV9C3D8_ACOCL|nr:hypothetical protein QJS10_CPB21g01394 [Acorus calamus]
MGGWVCMADDRRLDVYLLNLFTGAMVTLPPLTTNVISEHWRGGVRPLQIRCDDGVFEMVAFGHFGEDAHLYKVVFSTEPTDPNCTIVVFFRRAVCMDLVYCRPGDERWALMDTSLWEVYDAVFYKEKLYVVTSIMGSVVAFDLIHQGQEIKMPTVNVIDRDWFCVPDMRTQVHLAVGPSGLLFILRHLIPHQTEMFKIFRLDETETKWVRTKSLDDGMLFVGLNTSTWLPSGNFKECKGNSIYFTDDVTNLLYLDDQFKDSGVFYLEDMSFGSIYGDDMKVLYPHPVWVIPNP